jgi:hypothetical protein
VLEHAMEDVGVALGPPLRDRRSCRYRLRYGPQSAAW